MITSKQRSILKSKCNTLKPSVNVGKGGLNEGLFGEIETALFHNEIAKIAVLKSCTTPAKELMNEVCVKLGAEPLTLVGGKFCVYKRSEKKDIEHILLF